MRLEAVHINQPLDQAEKFLVVLLQPHNELFLAFRERPDLAREEDVEDSSGAEHRSPQIVSQRRQEVPDRGQAQVGYLRLLSLHCITDAAMKRFFGDPLLYQVV